MAPRSRREAKRDRSKLDNRDQLDSPAQDNTDRQAFAEDHSSTFTDCLDDRVELTNLRHKNEELSRLLGHPIAFRCEDHGQLSECITSLKDNFGYDVQMREDTGDSTLDVEEHIGRLKRNVSVRAILWVLLFVLAVRALNYSWHVLRYHRRRQDFIAHRTAEAMRSTHSHLTQGRVKSARRIRTLAAIVGSVMVLSMPLLSVAVYWYLSQRHSVVQSVGALIVGTESTSILIATCPLWLGAGVGIAGLKVLKRFAELTPDEQRQQLVVEIAEAAPLIDLEPEEALLEFDTTQHARSHRINAASEFVEDKMKEKLLLEASLRSPATPLPIAAKAVTHSSLVRKHSMTPKGTPTTPPAALEDIRTPIGAGEGGVPSTPLVPQEETSRKIDLDA